MAKKIFELPKLPYGQGSYSWDNSDKTVIKYRKPVGEDDNKKYLSVKGKTIQECNSKMKQKELEWINDNKTKKLSDPNNKTITFAKASYNWMNTFKSTQLKGKSFDTLETTYLNQILKAPFANFQISSITDVEIQNYLNFLKKKGYSFSTIKKTYSFINQFCSYIYRKEPYLNPMISVVMPEFTNDIILDENGVISNDSKAIVTKEYEILDDDEIKRFTHIASLEILNGVQGYKHGWGLIFMMWTFIRFGEAVGLQWRDIDFEERSALVYKTYSRIKNRDDNNDSGKNYRWSLSTTKTKSGVRKFFLCEQAITALQEYKKIQNPKNDYEFIFSTDSGLPLSNSNLNITLKKMLKNANINKKISIHGLRHTGISYFIRHDVDKDVVAKMAGHSNSKITDNVYYTILSEQQKIEIEKINKLLKERE